MDEEHLGFRLNLKEIILAAGRKQIPQLNQADPKEVDGVMENALRMIAEFTALAQAIPHPEIREDTDVVWVVPGPGAFSSEVTPLTASEDRYTHLPWSRKMDRARIRTGSAIFRKVASLRAKKPITELSQDDFLKHGPIFIYTGIPLQNENFNTALSDLSTKYRLLPKEKVYLFDKISNPDGTFRDSYNTIDAVESLSFPDGVVPRRMVIVTHAEHLVRVLYILGKFHESIPESTIIQPYPLATPEKGRLLYAEMEVRGIFAAIYGLSSATPQPYPYQV